MIVIASFMLCLLRCFTDNAEVKTNVPRLEQRADEQTFIASAFVQCMGILLAKRSGRADQFLLLKQDRALFVCSCYLFVICLVICGHFVQSTSIFGEIVQSSEPR